VPGYRRPRRPPTASKRDRRQDSGGDTGRQDPARRDAARRSGLPRRTAYDVLAAVAHREAYANLLLPRLLAERNMTGRDAALATELAYGTLRGQGTYDAVLAACSDRPLDKLDPPVLLVLRLGAHQLLNTRVGAYAAVATSVDLAKAVAGPRVSGYVNAVLRRVATRDLDAWLELLAPDVSATTGPATGGPAAGDADRDERLALRHSHPAWIVAAYRDALGKSADEESADEELEAALAAGNARPRVTLAAFPGGRPRQELMPAGAEPGRWSPYAFTLASGDPAGLTASGAAAVQDEGSQLAAIALARAAVAPVAPLAQGVPLAPVAPLPQGVPLAPLAQGVPHAPVAPLAQGVPHAPVAPLAQGVPHAPLAPVAPVAPLAQGVPVAAGAERDRPELWLDMCAGPGGKSRLLAGLATAAGGRLIAAEIHPHRAALVQQAIARAKDAAPVPPEFQVLVADGRVPPWPDGVFDRVLLDVPCSGLGALRRRPEARWRKSAADIPALAELQRALLRSAVAAVRPGGVVAYVTCSPVPEETRDVVADVAGAAGGVGRGNVGKIEVEVLDAPAVLSDIPALRSPDPRFAQLWPHRHGTDAIFIALLRRVTSPETARLSSPRARSAMAPGTRQVTMPPPPVVTGTCRSDSLTPARGSLYPPI
jgi:16S rRNA (cytosine967-C5)-methyltransferase